MTNETEIKHNELGNTIREALKVLNPLGYCDPTLLAYEAILEAADAVIEATITDTSETMSVAEALIATKACNEARALSEEMVKLIKTHKATFDKVFTALGKVTR